MLDIIRHQPVTCLQLFCTGNYLLLIFSVRKLLGLEKETTLLIPLGGSVWEIEILSWKIKLKICTVMCNVISFLLELILLNRYRKKYRSGTGEGIATGIDTQPYSWWFSAPPGRGEQTSPLDGSVGCVSPWWTRLTSWRQRKCNQETRKSSCLCREAERFL